MSDLRDSLRRILADRHSPEAAALFQTLLRYVHRRVSLLAQVRCEGLLGEADQEEVLAEVLYQLMSGALARFRGETLPELLGFVKVMTDRTAWRVAERKLRERNAVERVTNDHDARWTRHPGPAPDAGFELTPDSPLPADDQRYLVALLQAGSKAELARVAGVSRAAVTQRIQRIQERIASLPTRDRASHEAWMQHQAAAIIDQV